MSTFKGPPPPKPPGDKLVIPLPSHTTEVAELKDVLRALVEASELVIEGRQDLAAMEASDRRTELMQHLREQARSVVAQYENKWHEAIKDAKEFLK